MKIHVIFSVLLLSFCVGSLLAQPTATPKKRVAVMKFQDKTDQQVGWWDQKSIGDGIADMIATELVKSGKYKVIERQNLDQVLKEQNLGMDGIVTPESAAKIGQVLGVELILMGAVTEFGYKKSENKLGLKGKNIGVGTQSAVCGLDVRFVNTTTGEILSADNVRKSKTTPSGSFSDGKLNFENKQDFDQSMAGKVCRNAVEDVLDLVAKQMANVSWSAKVMMEKSGQVYLNSGANDGVSAGMVLKVFRKGEALVDPDTGMTLGTVDAEVGELEVVDPKFSDGKVSVCRVKSGSGYQKGDIARWVEH